jgi:hypothetical protein
VAAPDVARYVVVQRRRRQAAGADRLVEELHVDEWPDASQFSASRDSDRLEPVVGYVEKLGRPALEKFVA